MYIFYVLKADLRGCKGHISIDVYVCILLYVYQTELIGAVKAYICNDWVTNLINDRLGTN